MFITLPQDGPYRQVTAGKSSQDYEVIHRRLQHALKAGVISDLKLTSGPDDTHVSFAFTWGEPKEDPMTRNHMNVIEWERDRFGRR